MLCEPIFGSPVIHRWGTMSFLAVELWGNLGDPSAGEGFLHGIQSGRVSPPEKSPLPGASWMANFPFLTSLCVALTPWQTPPSTPSNSCQSSLPPTSTAQYMQKLSTALTGVLKWSRGYICQENGGWGDKRGEIRRGVQHKPDSFPQSDRAATICISTIPRVELFSGVLSITHTDYRCGWGATSTRVIIPAAAPQNLSVCVFFC